MFIAPFGSFRTLRDRPYEGEHYAAFFYEWRWGGGIFELFGGLFKPLRALIRPMVGNPTHFGMGWALHGGHGRTWLPQLDFEARHTDQWHHEAGLSLTVFNAINADVTWRLDRRRRRFGLSFVHSF
ncbi:MAG: hypothetical protein VCF24_22455 [Candidatus Latescibacterota bacterium]